jgi:formamidopyrimidine-DNA glycosylase
MPELPEVETVVRALHRQLAGRRLTHPHVWKPEIIESGRRQFLNATANVKVERVRRRGKWILIDLATGQTILAHLRMTGRFAIVDNGAPREKHDHLEWTLDDGRQRLRFNDLRRFGRFRIVATPEVEDYLQSRGWGPEPLEIDTASFHQRLGRGKRSVKAALLDQSVVAGLGNIYVDEILFAAGIDPRSSAGKIGPARALRIHTTMINILVDAIRACGTSLRNYASIDGTLGEYKEQLRVFRKDGSPCPKCGRAIRRIKLAGRSTHFCARCQRRA